MEVCMLNPCSAECLPEMNFGARVRRRRVLIGYSSRADFNKVVCVSSVALRDIEKGNLSKSYELDNLIAVVNSLRFDRTNREYMIILAMKVVTRRNQVLGFPVPVSQRQRQARYFPRSRAFA